MYLDLIGVDRGLSTLLFVQFLCIISACPFIGLQSVVQLHVSTAHDSNYLSGDSTLKVKFQLNKLYTSIVLLT